MCRRRRFLKLALIPGLGFLFCIASLAFPRQQNLPIDAALDAVLNEYLRHLPAISESERNHCSSRDSPVNSPQSPRDFQPPEKYTSQYVAKACELLSTKKILFVGPETTYYLHSLWLNALERYEHRTRDCHGPEFCKFHHICLPAGYTIPNDRFKIPPTDEHLVVYGSVLLRYVLSTSLHTAPDENDIGYTEAVVDPATGIRTKNALWLLKARKADIILMNRGPIPAPAWTFAGHRTMGNWTFVRELPRHFGQDIQLNSLAAEVVNAAFHATVTRFIPEVLQSLRAIHKDPLIRQKTFAWHASWFSGAVEFHLPRRVDDPWSLYYNAQGEHRCVIFFRFSDTVPVYMENYLLKALLPHHGVHFLPRIAPIRILADNTRAEQTPQDRLRFPVGTPNAQGMATAFLKSLIELLECVQ